jgi:hypothetical protein
MYYQSFTLDANTMDTNATGFTYSVNAPYTGPIARFSTGGSYDLWLNAPYSGNGYGLAFRTRNGDAGSFNSWQFPAVYGVNANGGGALYATIYYDQDNTGYYLNPNSTTSIRTVGSWRSDSSTWDGEFSGKIQYHSSHWYFQSADQWIWRNAGGSNVIYGNQSGELTATGNMRSPIFYDSDNTGYYLNPAGASYLYSLQLSGAQYFRPNTWIQMDASYGMYWPNHYGLHVYANDGGSYGALQIGGSKNGWSGIYFNVSGNSSNRPSRTS